MTIEMMKAYLKENNYAKLVREYVEGAGWEVNEAVEYVYDSKTLTRAEFLNKYYKPEFVAEVKACGLC